MKCKIKLNWFVDFDKEERWLNKMATNGLCLWYTNGVIYRFKECRPDEYIFQVDFDEKKSSTSEDYIAFRTSCGDELIHQWKSKIYWKRAKADGPFEREDNIMAKLRMTNKAYDYHIKSLIGLTLIMAAGCFICIPLGQYILPESIISDQVRDFGLGLSAGILAAECVLLIPIINKLRKKIKELMKKVI